MGQMHRALLDDYHTEDGTHSQADSLIAAEIARLFLQEGCRPTLLDVRGELLPDGINHKSLSPRVYQDRVTWGGHVVCENEGIVYDPMVGEPMPKEEYAKEVFDGPVTLEEVVSSESIADFVGVR